MKMKSNNIENVYIYIADAVRWDSVPESLLKKGLTYKMVASSIHTPTSFPTIASGLHPPQHGCWDFRYSLNEDAFSIFDIPGYSTRFADSGVERFNPDDDSKHIVSNVLNQEHVPYEDLSDIESPFVFVERGQGGHAPYGGYFGPSDDYFASRGAAETSTYRREYLDGISEDLEHFRAQLKRLEERGLLEETLVIYTSDHGELLGEGGCLAHNDPIHPKHVYVPFILIHSDLDSQRMYDVARHVDILPTILGLLDEENPQLPGSNLLEGDTPTFAPTYYRRDVATGVPFISGQLDYRSVWDTRGGYVFPNTSTMNRGIIYTGKLMKSIKREYMRRNIREGLQFYLADEQLYGVPSFDREEAIDHLESIEGLPKSDAGRDELTEGDRDHLRSLGYLE